MLVKNFKLLWFWSSFLTSCLKHSSGRTLPFRPLHHIDASRGIHSNISQAFLPLSMRNGHLVTKTTLDDTMLVNISKFYGKECPKIPKHQKLSFTKAPFYAVSTCPWYYERDFDPNRFPASLPVAVHKCSRHCVGLPEDIRDSFTCDYIFSNMTVLMKEYSDNVPRFVEKIQTIRVGSTCVRKERFE